MNAFCILSILLFVVLIKVKGDCDSVSTSKSITLKNDLLCNYDKDLGPLKKNKEVVDITVRIVLKHVSYDWSRRHTMKIHNWIGVSWTDPLLQWDPKEYGSIKSIHMDSDQIWTPSLKQHDEGKGSKVLESAACAIRSTGSVVCATAATNEAMCEEHLKKWPYSTYICVLAFGSNVHNTSLIKLHMHSDPVIMVGYTENPQWQLNHIQPYTLISQWGGKNISESFESLRYNFSLTSHSGASTAYSVLPGLVLSLITIMTPCVTLAGVERLSLAFINIFSHFFFMLHIQWLVPYNGDTTPFIFTYAQSSLALCVMALMMTLFLRSIICNKSIPPIWLLGPSRIVAHLFEQIWLMDDLENLDMKGGYVDLQSLDKNEYRTRILITQVIDRIFFIGSFATYLIMIINAICL